MVLLLAGFSNTGFATMTTKQQIVFVACSYVFLILLILMFATPATHGMSNRNVVVRGRPQLLSLKMLARVVRYCEKHDKPMHPGIVRWASASLTTDETQFVRTDSRATTGLRWSK